jgi:hypothetical protein
MIDGDMEVVRGSGNVFRDFDNPDADVRQAKALLAAQIIKVLYADHLQPGKQRRKQGSHIVSSSASATSILVVSLLTGS